MSRYANICEKKMIIRMVQQKVEVKNKRTKILFCFIRCREINQDQRINFRTKVTNRKT